MRRFVAALWVAGAAAVAAGPAFAGGDPVEGQKRFKVCMACHRIGPDAGPLVGPPLNGIVGRKAAQYPEYPYSTAMKESGLTWDEATLTRYLHAPREVVPGTRMTFAGLRKDEDVANVIAYLKTFDANGNPVPPP